MPVAAAQSNPFATRFTKPGALRFRFAEQQSLDLLHDRLSSNHWIGQIVGPHGSGKTTLLRGLDNCWPDWGRRCIFISLHDGCRRLPLTSPRMTRWRSCDQVVVDGYEQLGLLARMQLSLHRRIQRFGLVVTAHRDVGLPMLLRTSTDEKLAIELVRELAGRQIPDRETVATFQRVRGNMRELFFALYESALVHRRYDRIGA